MSTWQKLSEEMIHHNSFGKYLISSKNKAKGIVDTVQLAVEKANEKIKIIGRCVKSNFNWNNQSNVYTTQMC